jgi:DNA-binding transcriptional ArsR family regulator
MQTSLPKLTWENATGYDFFVSLHVLHEPSRFALRGAWAKGVRSRLPQADRECLEEISGFLLGALPWVFSLPGAKDGEGVLDAYAGIPGERRLPTILASAEMPPEVVEKMEAIASRGRWTDLDRAALLQSMKGKEYEGAEKEFDAMLDLWARASDYGERSLEAFISYYKVFFSEEEARIQPALRQAVERGQEMAEKLPTSDLLAELSEGIRFEENALQFSELVMVPSFWIAPRVFLTRGAPGQGLFFHGGRPEDTSLVPGETVPDALYRTLKALADPTRLRILHYLEEQPQTPTELSKVLRLRAPTVIHHLNTLRLAGLVYVTFGHGDKRYAARTSRISEMYLQLRRYLGSPDMHRREDLSGRPPYVA